MLRLLARFYIGSDAFGRLQDTLAKSRAGQEYTFARLVQLTKPSSPERLSRLLTLLEKKGKIKRVVRVESPANTGGIADFPSFQEVPPEIYDWRQDVNIRVSPENLRVVYTV
jgi:hypothetical protein